MTLGGRVLAPFLHARATGNCGSGQYALRALLQLSEASDSFAAIAARRNSKSNAHDQWRNAVDSGLENTQHSPSTWIANVGFWRWPLSKKVQKVKGVRNVRE